MRTVEPGGSPALECAAFADSFEVLRDSCSRANLPHRSRRCGDRGTRTLRKPDKDDCRGGKSTTARAPRPESPPPHERQPRSWRRGLPHQGVWHSVPGLWAFFCIFRAPSIPYRRVPGRAAVRDVTGVPKLVRGIHSPIMKHGANVIWLQNPWGRRSG